MGFMKIICLGGALRQDSLNHKLVSVAAEVVRTAGHDTEVLRLRDFPMPLYDGDIEASSGIPATVKELSRVLSDASAVIVATPAYNYSLPGVLKNTIDWLSRDRPHPFAGKPYLLLGASPGLAGAILGVNALRAPLEGLGAFVYPQIFTLPSADKSFTPEGKLSAPSALEGLSRVVRGYLEFADKLKRE
jgi:chromate reductase